MNTTIRLKIKKDVDIATTRKILKLKGNLIAQSYTDIIHYDDGDSMYYLNTFISSRKDKAIAFIEEYVSENVLKEIVVL